MEAVWRVSPGGLLMADPVGERALESLPRRVESGEWRAVWGSASAREQVPTEMERGVPDEAEVFPPQLGEPWTSRQAVA